MSIKKKSKIHLNILQGTVTVDSPTTHNLRIPPINNKRNCNKKLGKMIKGKRHIEKPQINSILTYN